MASAADTKRAEAQLELEKNKAALDFASRATQSLLSDAAGAALGTNVGQLKWANTYRKVLTQVFTLYKELL